MSDAAPPRDRRAQLACLTGLLIQLVLFGVVLTVGLWSETRSDAVVAVARHLLGGVLIWLILFLVFRQRRRSRLEDMETEQLKRAETAGLSTNLFDASDESLLLERRRLTWTVRFLLPFFTVLTIVYHVGGTFLAWTWPVGRPLDDVGWHRSPQPLIAMIFAAAAAFVCFVYARYVIGMSRQPNWRLLRAGGSYLIGSALTATVLAVSMAMAGSQTTQVWAESLAAYVVRFMLLLLGVEFTVNFILEFYRPRRTDDEIRPAFDSRLLALFGEPGGIVRSIADTINYQFGFEVSSTWFYKLLQRSVFPLVTLTVVALILLSSIVIVDVDEQAYIERFGKIQQASATPLGPGFGLKYPWPIDRVVRARVQRMHMTTVGTKHEELWKRREHVDDHSADEVEEHEMGHAVLWTEEHTHLVSGMLMVVANQEIESHPAVVPSPGQERPSAEDVGVSLLMVSATIEYHISDLHDHLYGYREPERVLETVAYQELSDYAAGHDAAYLMGKGRAAFSREMKISLQQRCDDMHLGVAITLVGLHAHPPSRDEVAANYQAVIAAEIRKQATIEHAMGAHSRILTFATGSLERANELDAAIREMNRAANAVDGEGPADRAAEAAQRVDDLLLGNPAKGIAPTSGLAAVTVLTARAERARAVTTAESKLRSFENDVAAYVAAPELFKMRRYLATLRDALPGVRKFIYTGDPSELIVEYETKQRATLDLETSNPAAPDHQP